MICEVYKGNIEFKKRNKWKTIKTNKDEKTSFRKE